MTTTERMLPPKQLDILKFIRDYQEAHSGRSPSVRKVQLGCGISSSSVVDYNAKKLRAAGYLTWDEGEGHSYRILKLPPELVGQQWFEAIGQGIYEFSDWLGEMLDWPPAHVELPLAVNDHLTALYRIWRQQGESNE